MGIAAAAAGIGAVGSIGGALLSSGASKSAANTQAQAADQASAAAQNEAQQTRSDLFPFMNIGQIGATNLEASLGEGGPGINEVANNGLPGLTYQPPAALQSVLNNPTFSPTQAQLAATPGYQFDLNQGLQATQNSNAAQGLGVSGAALKGAAQYATGLANNTLTTQAGIFQNNYGNALQANQLGQSIFQGNLQNILNPLMNQASLGENAGAQTGSLGTQGIANANALQVGGANALASGTVGSANALSSGLGSLSSAPLNYALYSQLLGGSGAGGGGLSGLFGGGGGYVDSGSF